MNVWDIAKGSLPQLIIAALKYTIPISVGSFIIALFIGLITALVRLSPKRGWFTIVKWIFSFYVWLFRSTPLLVQLFIAFFGLPYLKIAVIFPEGIKLTPIVAGVLIFSLNTGAYSSESIRAAIQSIPKGQWEAGYSIGMTKRQILTKIILPQAARISLPPLSNSFISLVKDTSLAASITILEPFQISQQIAAQNYQPLIMYTLVAIVYAVLCTILTWLQVYLEKATSKFIQTNN